MAGPEEQPPLRFETLQVHSGTKRSEDGVEGDIPIYASTSFVFNDSAHGAAIFGMNADAFCYSRLSNPTNDAFENRIAALEGGLSALSASSAEAALFMTITSLASIGSNIIIASEISDASLHQLRYRLPHTGIQVRPVPDQKNVGAIKSAIDEHTKAVLIESISTKSLLLSDIEAVAAVAHGSGVPLVVDNTAGAGGFLVRPIDYGADIVIASTAPYLSISGSVQGGVIIDSGKFDWNKHKARFPQFTEPSPGFHGLNIWKKFGNLSFIRLARIAVLRDIGPCMNPFQSFQLLAGLETLAVRVERQVGNALALAKWLQENENVGNVVYPGLSSHESELATKYLPKGCGSLLFFSIKHNEASNIFSRRLKVVTSSSSIGGSKTSIIRRVPVEQQDFHTEKTPDQSEDSSPLYLSVGLEHIDDLIADFKQALEAVGTKVNKAEEHPHRYR